MFLFITIHRIFHNLPDECTQIALIGSKEQIVDLGPCFLLLRATRVNLVRYGRVVLVEVEGLHQLLQNVERLILFLDYCVPLCLIPCLKMCMNMD